MSSKLIRSLLLALAIPFITTGCMFVMRAPSNLDYARTRPSQSGMYRATIMPDGDSIPTGKLQKWTLHVESANGSAVESASIAIKGGMPQHGHGLPTKPQMTRELGKGDYLIEGMKFNMGGWWEVHFRVNSAIGTDSVVFNIKL